VRELAHWEGINYFRSIAILSTKGFSALATMSTLLLVQSSGVVEIEYKLALVTIKDQDLLLWHKRESV